MNFLEIRLNALATTGLARALPQAGEGVDFWSNDYLGIAREVRVDAAPHGATGSRLISGNYVELGELEKRMATFHGFPAALFFASGYTANLGLISALSRRTDTVLYDELIHASLRDGIRLGQGRSYRFRHNDPEDLEKILTKARPDGEVFVVTESRFSMDGDVAPLAELAERCARRGAHLIVDEAHSSGLEGPGGAGVVAALGLHEKVFATVVTHGKGFGAHGAAVLGSRALVDYLVSTARPFIYATAPPPAQVAAVRAAYDRLGAEQTDRYRKLCTNVGIFRDEVVRFKLTDVIPANDGPIQIVRLAGNAAVLAAEAACRAAGFLVKGIRSPTVAAGAERLRICLHAFNTPVEIHGLVKIIAQLDLRRG